MYVESPDQNLRYILKWANSVEHSPFFLLYILWLVQYTLSIGFEKTRRNPQSPRSNAVVTSRATSRSTRLLQEMENRKKQEEIPSSWGKHEYTKILCTVSKSSSQVRWSLYSVTWVPWQCGIESTRCQTHRSQTLRGTGWFRWYEW